jgi:hypothetical protein
MTPYTWISILFLLIASQAPVVLAVTIGPVVAGFELEQQHATASAARHS